MPSVQFDSELESKLIDDLLTSLLDYIIFDVGDASEVVRLTRSCAGKQEEHQHQQGKEGPLSVLQVVKRSLEKDKVWTEKPTEFFFIFWRISFVRTFFFRCMCAFFFLVPAISSFSLSLSVCV